jgi:hypothetical protein
MRTREPGDILWSVVAVLIGAVIILGFALLTRWIPLDKPVWTVVWTASYVVLIVKDLGVRLAFVATVALCVTAVPFLYALVLFIQLPLVVFGLTPFHAHVYFVRSLYGALAAAAIAFFAFKDRAESTADDIAKNLRRSGYRLRWGELFNLSTPKASGAVAIVLLVPCLFVLPATRDGIVASGVLWGIMMGLVEVLITLRVEDLSLREGWKRVAMLEALTAILFAGEVGYYWIDRSQFRWFMLFLPAGAICYAATYGLIHLTTVAAARLGLTWPAGKGDDEVPGLVASALGAVVTGDVLDRIPGYRDSSRRLRIRLPNGDVVSMEKLSAETIAGALARVRAETAVRRALVVATGEYEDPALARLRRPVKDADTLARVLRDRATGRFEVDLLTDADGSTVRQRIVAFLAERDPDDLLMLYLSGHVVTDAAGRLHLAARDTGLAALDGTGVPASFVRDQLDRTASRRVVLVLDCCHSEMGAAEVGSVGEAFGAGAGRAVLTASSTTEYTFEGADLIRSQPQPSVFTTVLASGLAIGKADRNGDGEITVAELFDYAAGKVRRRAPGQTPMRWGDGTISLG